MKAMREDFLGTMHAICNELVEVDGDTAYSEAYFVAYHRFNKVTLFGLPVIEDRGTGGVDSGREYKLTLGGRYVDRFERRQGVWKIANRVVAYEWDSLEPAGRQSNGFHPVFYSLRSRDDIVYKR